MLWLVLDMFLMNYRWVDSKPRLMTIGNFTTPYIYIGDYRNPWTGNPVLNQPVSAFGTTQGFEHLWTLLSRRGPHCDVTKGHVMKTSYNVGNTWCHLHHPPVITIFIYRWYGYHSQENGWFMAIFYPHTVSCTGESVAFLRSE